MNGRLRRLLAREHGQAVIEALFPVLIVFVLTVGAVLIFLLYANALLAQNALTQTALYASSTGTWTQQQADACVRHLPGEQAKARCWLERQQGSRWLPVEPICGETAAVGDCLNRRNPYARSRFEQRPLEETAAVPLRLHVSYVQHLPGFCFSFSSGSRNCIGAGPSEIERTVVVYSQTWRRD